MNSTSTFQDLINLDTTEAGIADLVSDIAALESRVDDNADSIVAQGVLINTNSINIGQLEADVGVIESSINYLDDRVNNNILNISNNTNLIETNISDIEHLNNTKLNLSGGIMSGNIDMGNFKIVNISDPTSPLDAANKKYIDDHATSNAYLRVNGTNSMTGVLNVGGNNINNVSLIDGYSLTVFNTLINANHQSTLINYDNIGINTNKIAQNILDIGYNTSAISGNNASITILQNNKLSKTGGLDSTMDDFKALHFGVLGKFIVNQPGYLSINSDENINFVTGINPSLSITQSNINNRLPTYFEDITTFNNAVTLNSTISAINTIGDLNMNGNDVTNVYTITNPNHDIGLRIRIKGYNASGTPITETTEEYQTNTVYLNPLNRILKKINIPTQFSERVNITHQIDALRFESDLSVYQNTIGRYSSESGNNVNGLQIKGYSGGSLSTSRHDGGNIGTKDSLYWDEYGDVFVRGALQTGSTINGYNLSILDNRISSNDSDIENLSSLITTNSSNISNNTTAISNNASEILSNGDDISILQTSKVNKAGDTMTGNLTMSLNDIISCDNIQLNTITYNGFLAPITIKTTRLIVDAENNGDCELLLKADSNNTVESFNPRVLFQQDGSLIEAAIFMNSNDLNISSSVSSGSGINLRCGAIDNAWESAPVIMSITPAGSVRLGITDTSNTQSGGLSIFGCNTDTGTYISGSGNDTTYNQIYLRRPGNSKSSGSNAYGWIIGNQYQNPSTSDLDLYFNCQRNGVITQPAYIADGTGLTRMNFTGQHRCMPMFQFTEGMIGLIVESSGTYMNMLAIDQECSQMGCLNINDSLPMVNICNSIMSKKVFGVISSEEDPNRRSFENGNFVSLYTKAAGDRRLYINSLGEGSIWVCNINGSILNGDYITSSQDGYGQKQDTEYLANYTVAKATMGCDFDPQMEEVKIYKGFDEEKQQIIWEVKKNPDGTSFMQPKYKCMTLESGVKIAFIGCTYHCG